MIGAGWLNGTRMGLNGISAWQWALILVVFFLAVLVAPGLARFRRARARDKDAAEPPEDEAPGGN
jgi:hypothetical protein